MKVWIRVAATAAVGVVGLLFSQVGTGSATDEPVPTYKWVDAHLDCVSTCDNKKFDCPCMIH
mgnify:CR=1 FL=1